MNRQIWLTPDRQECLTRDTLVGRVDWNPPGIFLVPGMESLYALFPARLLGKMSVRELRGIKRARNPRLCTGDALSLPAPLEREFQWGLDLAGPLPAGCNGGA